MKKLVVMTVLVIFMFSCSNQSTTKENELKKEVTSIQNLEIGQIIDIQNAKLQVSSMQISMATPVNKVKPKKSGNQFILIGLKIKELNKDVQLSSVLFVLKDALNNKYSSPGSWGKIDIGGGLSNFEATDGATVYSARVDDEINLFFEVPDSILPKKFMLEYNWK